MRSIVVILFFCFSMVNGQPVKDHGKLSVKGIQLTDEYGNAVVLRGMSFGWHNFWPRFYNKNAVAWLAKDWKCSVVRAAMGVEPEDGYLQSPLSSEAAVEAVVDAAIKADIYVIIDWHSHNIKLDEATAFFKKMATKYGSYPNIIYEIFNEPDTESWQEVKAYSQEVITAIRTIDPDNIILVGNPHWDQDINLVADDPLIGFNNIMYTMHFYAATHRQPLRNRTDSALSKGIPVFISESAGMEATGDAPLDMNEWQIWISWAERNKLSWVTWSVSDKDETCSVLKKGVSATGKWKEKDLKESGTRSREFLRKYNAGIATGNTKKNMLSANELLPFGRSDIDNSGKLELISSAVHSGFSFMGNECRIFANTGNENSHNYLQYELDGIYRKRIRINGNSSQPYKIVTGENGNHTVWIYKATEAHTGPVLIEKVEANDVKALPNPKQPLIEFIGNSITCGAAADPSEVPCGIGEYHDQHNAYNAYGPRVARALHTDFILSSVSGIGVYRNWNSDGPTMPQVYEKSNFQPEGAAWDFTKYSPQIVSIALGTNDLSDGDGKHKRLPFDSALFVSHYIRFVQLVKGKYPSAQIALLSSPMMSGDRRVLLQNCLTAVKINADKLYPLAKPVAIYFFKPMQPHGCSGHPGVEDHAVMAAELVPFFHHLLEKE